MKKWFLCLSLGLFLFSSVSSRQNIPGTTPVEIKSPDGRIIFSYRIKSGYPTYSISFKGKTLIDDSQLSLDFKGTGDFGRNLTNYDPAYRTVDESYNLVVGKTKTVRNFFHEVAIPLAEKNAPFHRINLVIRAFNDGIAFRYEFPEQEKWTSFSLKNENTTFRLSGNPDVLNLFRANFCTYHEGLYTSLKFNEIKPDTLMDLPALFDFQGIYMAITEAELVDYAGMYLISPTRLKKIPGMFPLTVKSLSIWNRVVAWSCI